MRKARELVFHLACFACDSCGRQLSTGEQFALMDDRVLCKAHYLETVEGGTTSSDGKLLLRRCGGRFAYLSVSFKQMVVMRMDTIKVRQNVFGQHSPKSNYKSYKLIFK